MRCLAAVVVVCLALAAAPPAARACSKHHQSVFELFDSAATVALVKVGAVPASGGGMVPLRARQIFKGGTRTLSARETNTSCRAGFRTGRTALVFVAADRWPAGAFEGYRERPSAELVAAITAYAAATTDGERLAVLIATIGGADRELVFDAAWYLADQPALISALTADQVAVVGAARADTRSAEVLAWIIARQHGPAWKALMAAGLPRSVALGALSRHDYEQVTDVELLADVIAKGKGEATSERIAALDRCERLHGYSLDGFTSYANGRSTMWWEKLAEACRTGALPRW